MDPTLASLSCCCGVLGLFYLDRDKKVRTSIALWLPAIWIGLNGSRPVSAWLGMSPTGVNVQLEGSPLDATVFGVLSLAAIGVLIGRGRRIRSLLASNWPVLVYFGYCLVSVAWSYHPDVALKRWIKAIGDVAMVLVIVSERQPLAAFGRVVSRVGFFLFPASVLLIKYYPSLGRGYDAFGLGENTGVSYNKNMLGVIVLVISLCTLWRVISLWRAKGQPDRRRHLIAQIILLGFGIWLFNLANSSTSLACFILGGGLIIATGSRAIRSKPARVHLLCLGIFLGGGLTLLLGGGTEVAHSLGRQSNLSGRTDIWAAVLASGSNPIVGTGYESYWISPHEIVFARILKDEGWWHPEGLNEAHDGYLEVYLQLGWIGVCLISLCLITGYGCAVAVYRLDLPVGGLLFAYIIVAAFYNITEAGFRLMDPMWIFLLLAIISSNAFAAELRDSKSRKAHGSRDSTANEKHISKNLIPTFVSVNTAAGGTRARSN
jgi:exopolysaccharide production protein ExoQ